MSDTKIYFSWKSLMPDKRQYKQNGTVLEPLSANVVVTLPVCLEFIDNYDEWDNPNIDPKTISPILTPAGMRYCIDQLEAVLSEPELNNEEFPEENTESKIDKSSNDDWGAQFDEEPNEYTEEEEIFEDNEENWK